VDGITNEMAKSGGLAFVEWLVRLFNLCMNMGNAPEDWRSAIVVPFFKVVRSNMCISLLSTPEKVYGSVLIERIS
jgi:hypothetical protein